MKILMVCLGNICRSPMAEGILRKKAEEVDLKITVDSAGTGDWHVGENPDTRAVKTAKNFGVDISKLIVRQFSENDFESFDQIFVMDKTNYIDVTKYAKSPVDKKKVRLLLDPVKPGAGHEVPDPYYGGPEGFIDVFEMMDKACDAIIEELKEKVEVAPTQKTGTKKKSDAPANKLYLVPALLSDENNAVIPEQTKEVIHSLTHFIAENEKSARHFLKAAGYPKPLQQTEMKVLDEHTDVENIPALLKPILDGADAGLISEAGCPAVADPGSELVRMAHEKNIRVVPLVGPSSILLALMASGLNGQSFSFAGYLPKERNERIKALKEMEKTIASKNQTQIFIETPYRNQHVFEDIIGNLNRNIFLCVACDLTSRNEWIKTMNIDSWRRKTPDLNKRQVVFVIGK